MGYKKATVKGFSWIVLLRGATRAMAFFKTIFLATILVPTQFGAYGVALLVLGLLEVITETGVNIILIQEEHIKNYINSAWIVSILRGVLIAVLIILTTPFIVSFFNSPDSKILLYAISFVALLRGFINPSVIRFQKELQFHKEFWYKFAILFVDSLCAVIFTLLTHNPIGIVIGLLVGVLLEVILSHIIITPRPKFAFERSYFNKIVQRGKWVTASSIGTYLFHNADNIVVGKILGTTSLGTYQIAYALSILPITEIADVLSRVTFPVFRKITNDTYRLRRAFFAMLFVVTGITLPFGLVLYVFPQEIITFILGNKWQAAVALLPILAIFGVVRAISNYSSTLYLAVGKQEYVTLTTFVSLIGLMVPLIPLVWSFGLQGAAFSALIGALSAIPFFIFFDRKILRKKDNSAI